MEQKWTLLVLGLIAGALYAFNAWVDVSWWMQSGYDMASYNPILIPVSWVIWAVFAYTTFIKGLEAGTAIYWFMSVIWLTTNLYFTYGMITYWLL